MHYQLKISKIEILYIFHSRHSKTERDIGRYWYLLQKFRFEKENEKNCVECLQRSYLIFIRLTKIL